MATDYLNLYVFGSHRSLELLIHRLGSSLDSSWELVASPDKKKMAGEREWEFTYTADNGKVGYIRFHSRPSDRFVMYLRDSGIRDSQKPISRSDNDFLVREFHRKFLEPVLSDLNLKASLTRRKIY